MLKLYKQVDNVLHYHEAWLDGRQLTEHWGVVGERGNSKTSPIDRKRSAAKNIGVALAKPLADGYASIELEDHATLLVEYVVEGMGTTAGLEKRHKLEERLNETLGWTGLGLCDGGSIGSGTMEVCCYVVDFEIAKRVIAEDLSGSEFADYERIYEENAD